MSEPAGGALDLGDRTLSSEPAALKRGLLEITALWLTVLLAIRAVVLLQESLGLHEVLLALVPFLFIYGPVGLCRLRGVDSFSYRLYVPAFRDGASWGSAARLNLRLLAIGIAPWLLIYHLYQRVLFGHLPRLGNLARYAAAAEELEWFRGLLDQPLLQGWGQHAGMLVALHLLTLVAYHLFFVAIPEEFFYRGYVQTRLNELLPRRFIIAGIPFGHSIWITALFFAFGHSLVELQWWHFATFFPGLLFGLLREKTGGVIAGALLHAACNVMVNLQDTTYGVVLPP